MERSDREADIPGNDAEVLHVIDVMDAVPRTGWTSSGNAYD